MRNSLRKLLGFAAIFATVLLLGVFLSEMHADRRYTIYNVRRELRAGMTRDEVQDIVSHHNASFLYKYATADRVILRVDTGLANSYLLSITFRDDRLLSAKIRGEDGPHEIFHDAPPDIIPNA
jgi:hypothetical protein